MEKSIQIETLMTIEQSVVSSLYPAQHLVSEEAKENMRTGQL